MQHIIRVRYSDPPRGSDPTASATGEVWCVYNNGGYKPLKLFREYSIIRTSDHGQIERRYAVPPVKCTVRGYFPPVRVYASECGPVVLERTINRASNVIGITTYYADGRVRQKIARGNGVERFRCLSLQDEKGRNCKLPDIGVSFFFYKACRSSMRLAMLQHNSGPSSVPSSVSSILGKEGLDVYVKMEVDKDAGRVAPFAYTDGPITVRVERAKVLSIVSRTDFSQMYWAAINCVYIDRVIIYRVGEYVSVPNFEPNCKVDCAPGIHGCLFIDQCDAWFAR